MQYRLAFGYFVNKPRTGYTNLLLLIVCGLIPIVGPIVQLGYQSEVAEALDRDPDLRRYPDLNFERFLEYLTRGVWPFLVGLILVLTFLIPAGLAVGVGIAVGAAANQPLAGLAVGVALVLAALAGLVMLSVPMTFHAQMTGRFDLGGAFRFATRFWQLVGGVAFTTGVVYFLLAIGISILGLLACFVGIYPAAALTHMAGEHLKVQVYREYLDRGGEPLTADELPEDEGPGDEEYEDDREDRGERDRWDDRRRP